jgi:hypothetical protein
VTTATSDGLAIATTSTSLTSEPSPIHLRAVSMSATTFAAAPCAECRRFAEPPFTPLYKLFGTRSRSVVCLDCHDAILHPEVDRVRKESGELPADRDLGID